MIVKDEEFPVGMRVLAVDDDSTCLMVLTTLLRKCQYHVTPVNEAIKALELLRNNKDKFDLVITDVDMPEMDGFTLLEYVGREMDLPVIMLSSYSDTELVMKGITHGACDYLLKPVRIEELKNIWQHVVRKKNLDRKERKPSNDPSNEEVKATEDVNKCIKPNKRRKEQNNVVENPEKEDLSTQKKSRLVWTPDLHRKFVAAVNKLGVNKAVPKKILDLMKDKRCTRENIASHLQKYRLYLKNYSGVANRQATKVRPFASVDSARAASIQNVSRSYPNASGFNIPFGLCGPSSSGTIQWNQIDNSRSSFNHDLHMFDEMPMPLDYSTMNLDSLANTVTSVFSELNVNGERNCGFANSMLMLEEEHDLNAPMVPNFEDNWHEQDTTTSDLGGNMLNSATQVIIKPNRDVSFLSSTFNALADVKTLNIIFQEFSPQQSQAFCPGDTSSLVNSPTIHHLSCEGHEFHVNDELLNSGENNQ